MDLQDVTVFYSICSEIVRAWPAKYSTDTGTELGCQRPNTFGVLKKLSDLDADNLGKTSNYIGKDFFYSRQWEQQGFPVGGVNFQYPLVGIALDRHQFGNIFRPEERQVDSTLINLFVMDQMPAAYKQKTYCNNRTDEELERDLRLMLKRFCNELGRFVYSIITNLDASTTEGWASLPWLEAERVAGNIASYTVEAELCNYFETPDVEAEVIFGIRNDLVAGIFTNVRLSLTDCSAERPAFNYGNPATAQLLKNC